MNFTNSLLFARKKLEQLNQYISLLPFIYVAALLLLYFLFYFLGIVTQLPYADRLVGFDAVIYNSIREKGYDYQWYTGNNAGFFPLFPYVWRWLCLGTKGICLLNFLCFCTGLALLIKEFKPAPILVLCFISVPSAIFRFLPFTESFFFLFCSIFLVGLSKNKPWLIITGLLLSSLTRPTAMFFIPAIIAAEVFYDERFFSWKAIKNILCYSAASLTGLFTVVLIQYYQTYEWFAFAKLQTKYWRHHFSLPQLPFTTNGGDKLLWLDGLAFFVSILATSILLFYFNRKIRLSKKLESFKLMKTSSFGLRRTFRLPDYISYSKIRLKVTVCRDSLLIGSAYGLASGMSRLPNELDTFISGESLKYSK